MKVTLLDTQTGETREVGGILDFWWAEGNGSCDCNREPYFGHNSGSDQCIGAKRYLIIKAEPVTRPPRVLGYTLAEYNEDYPKELLDKFLPKEGS